MINNFKSHDYKLAGHLTRWYELYSALEHTDWLDDPYMVGQRYSDAAKMRFYMIAKIETRKAIERVICNNPTV